MSSALDKPLRAVVLDNWPSRSTMSKYWLALATKRGYFPVRHVSKGCGRARLDALAEKINARIDRSSCTDFRLEGSHGKMRVYFSTKNQHATRE